MYETNKNRLKQMRIKKRTEIKGDFKEKLICLTRKLGKSLTFDVFQVDANY